MVYKANHLNKRNLILKYCKMLINRN